MCQGCHPMSPQLNRRTQQRTWIEQKQEYTSCVLFSNLLQEVNICMFIRPALQLHLHKFQFL